MTDNQPRTFLVLMDGKLRDMPGSRHTESGAAARVVEVSRQKADANYSIVEVAHETWDATLEQREMRRWAQRLFTDHGHAGYWDDMTRANCQACCLGGWRAKRSSDEYDSEHDVLKQGPNVANWQRDYVQAGHVLWSTWVEPFIRSINETDNLLWREALLRDIRTWGVSAKTGRTASAEIKHYSFAELVEMGLNPEETFQ